MTKACPVYTKIWNALPNTKPEIRHAVSDTICRSAAKYKINTSRLSAKEIVAAIGMKQAYIPPKTGVEIQDKKYPPSTAGTGGIKDKKYDQSLYETEEQCQIALVNQGASLAIAKETCTKQFASGHPESMVSGTIRKNVTERLAKQYPNLSKQAIQLITDNAVRETTRKENIAQARKNVVPVKGGATHLYSAKLDAEIPSYLYIDMVKSGEIHPSDKIVMKPDQRVETIKKIKSANTIINPLWVGKDFNRNMIDYYNQRRTNNIKQANTTTDNRPAWLVISDHLKGQ